MRKGLIFLIVALILCMTYVRADTPCDLCEYVIFDLEQSVNKSIPELQKRLLKVCDSLPTEYSSLCKAFVTMYGPKIIQTFLEKENPKEGFEIFFFPFFLLIN